MTDPVTTSSNVDMPAANTVTYQMRPGEVIRTAFRRRVSTPSFIANLAVPLTVGMVLVVVGNSPAALLAKGKTPLYFGLFFVAYAVLAPLGLYLTIRRLVGKWPWLTAPTTFSFSDAGITIAAPGRRTELSWSAFRSWSQTRDHVFLYLDTSHSAVTIPRRAFSAEQLQSLMSCLARISA